mmetsp:Transcript_4951/g.14079  ORF Transcript_4951/g.14079 Transcript_4951/m.14079 type:complete len:331 (+) Transcript_4951:383-1375(+)
MSSPRSASAFSPFGATRRSAPSSPSAAPAASPQPSPPPWAASSSSSKKPRPTGAWSSPGAPSSRRSSAPRASMSSFRGSTTTQSGASCLSLPSSPLEASKAQAATLAIRSSHLTAFCSCPSSSSWGPSGACLGPALTPSICTLASSETATSSTLAFASSKRSPSPCSPPSCSSALSWRIRAGLPRTRGSPLQMQSRRSMALSTPRPTGPAPTCDPKARFATRSVKSTTWNHCYSRLLTRRCSSSSTASSSSSTVPWRSPALSPCSLHASPTEPVSQAGSLSRPSPSAQRWVGSWVSSCGRWPPTRTFSAILTLGPMRCSARRRCWAASPA